MTTTTRHYDAVKAVRVPRLRRLSYAIRATAKLIEVWLEVWPAVLATIAAHYGVLPLPVVGCALFTAFLFRRAWRAGALRANVTDTWASIVRYRWRCLEITTYQHPRLISVKAHGALGPLELARLWRIEGRHAIGVDHLEIIVRPNDSQGSDEWTNRFGDWLARHHGFERYDALPATISTNCIAFTLARRAIPNHVHS